MAFEPVYNVIKADYKKRMASAQTVVECKLTPEAPAQIKKVLSIVCAENITSCEVLNGEARITGRVNFKVLFCDMEGNTHCMAADADFSDKMAGNNIAAGVKAYAECSVVDTDTVSVSAAEIKLACVLEIQLFSNSGEQITHLKEGGEDLFAQKETISFCALAAEGDEAFLVTDERAVKERLNRILMCEAQSVIRNAAAGTDCFMLEGTVVTSVTCETEDKAVCNIILNTDFKQEIAGDGALSAHDALASVSVKSVTAVLEKDAESGSNIVKAEITLTARAAAYSQQAAEVVTDAFCIKNELSIATESFKVSRYLLGKCFNEKIEGSAALDAGMPFIDGITAVCGGRMNIANAFAEKDKIRLEGLVNTGVIYWNRETDTKNSVQVELPFSMTLNSPGVSEGCEIMAKGIICDVTARPRKGAEIDISAAVCVHAQVFETRDGMCVKEVEIGPERNLKMSAIAVYITKEGETLWDVAKALCTTPELIMSYNPGLKVPLSGGEKILVYRQKNVIM